MRSAGCPGSRGFRDPGEASVWESCWWDKLQLQHAPFVHADQSPLLVRAGAEAAWFYKTGGQRTTCSSSEGESVFS